MFDCAGEHNAVRARDSLFLWRRHGDRDVYKRQMLPFNVTCCICFRTLYSKRINSQALSLLLCVLWAGAWSVLVLNDTVFRAISVPAWVSLLAASVFFMGYTLYRGQRKWQTIMEVKPLWI